MDIVITVAIMAATITTTALHTTSPLASASPVSSDLVGHDTRQSPGIVPGVSSAVRAGAATLMRVLGLRSIRRAGLSIGFNAKKTSKKDGELMID
ncbi:hypothetical protein ARMSODRAFT_953037 [Armillaria solidipes]|uniref:Uncharacterized protein n=1 Tax=Armillaria solidipes TaxID=1076256 RepID=A0A2H3BUK1_9AGAR|nr:hypothetical protein ARMSODRAFT_953037 [Armillaria solidipes]